MEIAGDAFSSGFHSNGHVERNGWARMAGIFWRDDSTGDHDLPYRPAAPGGDSDQTKRYKVYTLNCEPGLLKSGPGFLHFCLIAPARGRPDIKAISMKEPRQWVAAIREACNACGVAYVFLQEIDKTHVSGATFWLNDTCALIVQSGRYKDDGHFWFTFFHEARHVLQGKQKKEWRIEGIGIEDALEKDADRVAGEFLVPVQSLQQCRSENGGKLPVEAVRTLARKLGIAPGIIAGRLMHDKAWHPPVANKLLKRFTIEELLSE